MIYIILFISNFNKAKGFFMTYLCKTLTLVNEFKSKWIVINNNYLKCYSEKHIQLNNKLAAYNKFILISVNKTNNQKSTSKSYKLSCWLMKFGDFGLWFGRKCYPKKILQLDSQILDCKKNIRDIKKQIYILKNQSRKKLKDSLPCELSQDLELLIKANLNDFIKNYNYKIKPDILDLTKIKNKIISELFEIKRNNYSAKIRLDDKNGLILLIIDNKPIIFCNQNTITSNSATINYGVCLITGKQLALKSYHLSDQYGNLSGSQKEKDNIIKCMKTLKHDNCKIHNKPILLPADDFNEIDKMFLNYDMSERISKNRIMMITHKFAGANLAEFIKDKNTKLSFSELISIIDNMAKRLKKLHYNDEIFTDLNHSNILFDKNTMQTNLIDWDDINIVNKTGFYLSNEFFSIRTFSLKNNRIKIRQEENRARVEHDKYILDKHIDTFRFATIIQDLLDKIQWQQEPIVKRLLIGRLIRKMQEQNVTKRFTMDNVLDYINNIKYSTKRDESFLCNVLCSGKNYYSKKMYNNL